MTALPRVVVIVALVMVFAGTAAHAQFSPDGRLLALPNGAALELWNVATRQKQSRLAIPRGYQADTVVYSDNGSRVMVRELQQTDMPYGAHAVAIWDIRGKPRLVRRIQENNAIFASGFSGNGQRVVTYGLGKLQTWDVAKGTHSARTVATSEAGTALDDRGHTLVVHVYEPKDQTYSMSVLDVGTLRWIARIDRSAQSWALSQDGTRLMFSEGDSEGRGIMPDTVHTVAADSTKVGEGFQIATPCHIIFSRDGNRLAASSSNFATIADNGIGLIVWDAAKQQTLWFSLVHDGKFPLSMQRPAAIAFSPDASMLAVSTLDDNTQVLVLDAETGVVQTTLKAPASVDQLMISPDEKTLVAVTGGRALTWWRLPTGEKLP